MNEIIYKGDASFPSLYKYQLFSLMLIGLNQHLKRRSSYNLSFKHGGCSVNSTPPYFVFTTLGPT